MRYVICNRRHGGMHFFAYPLLGGINIYARSLYAVTRNMVT